MLELDLTPKELKKIRKAFRQAPEMAAKEMGRGMFRISEGFLTQHTRDKLRGRPGLILRHGQAGLGGSMFSEKEGSTLDDLKTHTFIGGTARKYAEIQEFGTVGKGGRFPDIVPKRAKYLKFQIDGKWIATKKVSIPPRLGWIDVWDSREDKREAEYVKTLKKIAESMAK